MQAFKQGDAVAFRELFERYKNAIYGFIRRRVDNPGRAEEIVQDVFLALVQHRNGYEVRSSFRTYLYRIAMNRVTSELRGNEKVEPLPSQESEAACNNPSVVRLVREALARLEPEQREVVLLREYEGLTYQEIAELLKIPLGTVRSRLFRAKVALRDLLAPAWAGGA